jgi:protocatechuate 3,4-dioxygenase beta subunit
MKKLLRAGVVTSVLALALTAIGVTPAFAATDTTGTVAITVTAPGGTPLSDASVSVQSVDGWSSDWGQTNSSGVFTTTELAAGAYDVTVDLWYPVAANATKQITVTANKDSAETITVTGVQAIKGTVKANGKAVTDGNVSAQATSGEYYSADIKSGKYVLLVKPGVSYTVRANSPYENPSWLSTYAGNTVRAEDGKKIKPSTSAPSTVNITANTKIGKISGTVVDAKGKAVKGANVWASALNRAGYGGATTDSKGKYTITGLPADTYYVNAGNTNSNGTITNVKVSVGKTAKATVKLKKYTTAKGKVVLTLKAPKALVKSNEACATLFDSKGYWAGSGCIEKSGGKITLVNLAAGTYKLALDGANVSKKVTVKKDKTTKVSMTRVAGTTLSGKITDSKGKAIAKAWVYVRDANNTGLRGVQTSSKGAYKFSGVVKGAYVVQAYPVKPSQGASTEKKVTLSGKKATSNVKLVKSATITGKVVNSKGKPVAGVQVSISTGIDWVSATTDSKGTYKLVGLHSGKHVVATYDPYEGGYFNGKSAKKSVGAGKTVAFATIKLKG